MKKIVLTLFLFTVCNLVIATPQKHKKHKTHYRPRHSSNKAHATNLATTTAILPPLKVTSSIPSSQINRKSIANQPHLYSYSALVMNANDGEILVSKNPNTQLPIASISKLMMAVVLLDSGANLDQYVTISTADIDTLRNTPSRLKVGMQLRRRDLLLLALMSSENRAAFALARTAYPGGIKVFIQKMNEKAHSLGMLNTHFYDPTGLTSSNQSTAEDLTKLVQAAFTYELIRQDTTTKGADVILGKNYIHRYINSDALVRAGKFHIELSKTGFINEAGHCLVLYSIINQQPIIMVFLNSAGKSGRLIDALAVKNYLQQQLN